MVAAIEYLKEIDGKRKIAILGDMFELGDFAEDLHRKVGAYVAEKDIDLLITVGENSKFIAKQAIENGMDSNKVIELESNEDAIKYLKDNMKSDDVLLLKAANGMKFAEIYDALQK